jgi:hypothetical protein
MIKLILIISFLLISVDGFAQLNQNNRVISSPAEIELSPNTKTISKKDINIESNYVLKLEDAAGGQYVGIKSPATVSPSWTLTLPDNDGTAGYLLSTDGAGVTSWIAAPSSFTNNASSGEVMISQGAGSGSGEAAFAYDFGTNVLSLDGQLNIKSQNELRLQDTTGGQYIGIRADGTTTSYTLTMPAAQGASGEVLQNNGSGVLSWAANGSPSSYSYVLRIGNAAGCGVSLGSSTDASYQKLFDVDCTTTEIVGAARGTPLNVATTSFGFYSNLALGDYKVCAWFTHGLENVTAGTQFYQHFQVQGCSGTSSCGAWTINGFQDIRYQYNLNDEDLYTIAPRHNCTYFNIGSAGNYTFELTERGQSLSGTTGSNSILAVENTWTVMMSLERIY